jgi:hypothetical protein
MLKCLNTLSKIDAKNAKLSEMINTFKNECKFLRIFSLFIFTCLDFAQKEKLSSSVVEFVDDLLPKLTSIIFAG